MKFRNWAAAFAGLSLLVVASFAQTAKLEGDVIGLDGSRWRAPGEIAPH